MVYPKARVEGLNRLADEAREEIAAGNSKAYSKVEDLIEFLHANASGKSNLLQVFSLLKSATAFSDPQVFQSQPLYFPYALHTDEASIYETEYVAEGMRFR